MMKEGDGKKDVDRGKEDQKKISVFKEERREAKRIGQ